MKPYRAGLLATASGLMLMLAACGGSSQPASSPTQAAVSKVFTYDTTTTVMNDGWDPATEYSDGIIAMSNMYQSLTYYNPATHTVSPMLATSWSTSGKGLTWTFNLRHNVHFHTGRLMTAAAAKAAIARTMKLGGGAAYIWAAVRSISTSGQYGLVFHLKYASPMDLEASADYSAYIYDTQAAGGGSLAKWLNTPHDAGTGPYTVQTWNKGQEFEVTLKAFPQYWGGWSGAHYQHVVYRVVPQDSTAAQLVRSGQVDFVEQISGPLWKSLRGAPGVTTVSAPSWQNLLAQLNTKTLSLPVRQAISYGINYPGIIAAVQGAGVLAGGLIPAGLLEHLTPVPGYSYDPAKAARLLHQAGYGPGRKPLQLSLTYATGDSNEQIVATLLKSSLAKLNISLSTRALSFPTQWAKAKSANLANHPDIFVEYWWPDYADPYSWFTNLLQTQKPPYFNLSYYSSPKLDRQINAVEPLVATNRAAASSLYHTMQTEIMQQAPIAVLYDDNYQYALRSSVSGFTVNPAYPNVVFAYSLKPTGS